MQIKSKYIYVSNETCILIFFFFFVRTHYYQAISEIVSNIVMDRRDSVTVEELGASAFGISVNNMIGKFNELDRLQEIARSAEEDKENAIRLAAENRELRQQIENLMSTKGSDTRNYKIENIAIRALLQQSNKTIVMLQEKLREKSDIDENYEDGNQILQVAAPIVVGDEWKWSGRKPDNITPLCPISTSSGIKNSGSTTV